MQTAISKNLKEGLAISDALTFCREHARVVLLASILILIPCIWHRHIEAGDLASHTYNAWLAQLIAGGNAPGLYIVPQWNNVLFDVSLYHLANLLGFPVGERAAVCSVVLLFFWAVFAFVTTITEKPPWFSMPGIAMLAYGYSFNMGFINYYVSIGLACFALSMCWHGGVGNCISAAAFAVLALVAHPIGFLWFASTIAYVFLWRRIRGRRRLLLPALVVAVFFGMHLYIAHHLSFHARWSPGPFYTKSGADQLISYGHRYAILAYAVLAWSILCLAVELVSRVQNGGADGQRLRLAIEFYVVALCVTALVPENLRTNLYAGWIGGLVSRLTLISAILGLVVLNSGHARKWYLIGFAACAAVFFVFLFQDTRSLNRLEDNADGIVASLPLGSHVVPVVNAPADWRAGFIYHVVERACIGHCFSYANYEPATAEFRIRVHPGSSIVVFSSDDAEAMASGDYKVKSSDPALTAIYQCDDSDFTKLCAAPLQPGETVETPALNSGEQ